MKFLFVVSVLLISWQSFAVAQSQTNSISLNCESDVEIAANQRTEGTSELDELLLEMHYNDLVNTQDVKANGGCWYDDQCPLGSRCDRVLGCM